MNRKLLAAGASYSLHLAGHKHVAWRWQTDVLPFVAVRNPIETDDAVVTAIPGVYPILFQVPSLGTYHSVFQSVRECSNLSVSGQLYGYVEDFQEVPVENYTFVKSCTHRWTDGGGVSPLGQTIILFPKRKLQPYLATNAGFVMFSRPTPTDYATRFNYTFEAGVGLQYYLRPKRAVAIDVRYHHISNANTGHENYGVDNSTVRIAYVFGR